MITPHPIEEDAMVKTDKQTLQRKLGKALKRLRERRGLTKGEVAVRMGKKRSAGTQLSRWEGGKAAPIYDQLWRFLIAVDANFTDLDRELNPRPIRNERLREIARELEALAPLPKR